MAEHGFNPQTGYSDVCCGFSRVLQADTGILKQHGQEILACFSEMFLKSHP
jgi:hypothetical protein